MKDNKKYFLVGCATVMAGIIVAFIILGIILGIILLAYAWRGNAGAITAILGSLFILLVLFSIPWRK